MTGFRAIAVAERSNSLRALTSRYSVHTARELSTAYNNRNRFTYFDYVIERSGSAIKITSKSGESTKIEIGDTKLTPEQRDTALEKTWDGVKEFFQKHWEEIESGEIKAADIGGAIYGITATVITLIFIPFTGGVLGKIIAEPFIWAAKQKGRYWGASVDEMLNIIKGESDLNKQQIAGVLATVTVLAYYLPGPAAVIQLGGVDAWNLTVDVGKKIGGTAADAVEEIVSVVGDIGEAVGGAIGGAIDDLIGIF